MARSTTLAVVSAAVFSLWTGKVGAAELWNGAKSGMTPSQVLAKFPCARLLLHPVHRPIGDELVEESGLTLGNMPLDAEFWFKDNRLQEVRLDVYGATIQSDGDKIATLLKIKYGNPRYELGSIMSWSQGDVGVILLKPGGSGNEQRGAIVIYSAAAKEVGL